jgi:hypothetical protein
LRRRTCGESFISLLLDVTRRGNPSLTRLKAPVPQPVVSGI